MNYPALMTRTITDYTDSRLLQKKIRIRGIYKPLSDQPNISPYGVFTSDKTGYKYYDVHIAAINRL